ncbi:MAG: saccharopine dehydrogenase NADP-binding domain-containing protein [Solirubrobacteraceae bacterium]|nr:saccharopine dehydrogenase NADP-binding domain-containing protein [Solirubrobacteraceae bacterium]
MDPVVVYAATGYTGRLISSELAARGVPVVVAGRNAERLAVLRDAVGAADIAVAALDDPRALRDAAARGRVIVNCASPFSASGDPVIRAAIEAGSHYLDTTGEQDWIRRVFEVHDGPLAAARVAAVPGMAFSHVPGDLLANLIGAPLAPLRRLLVAYHVEGFDMTRGTMHSSLEQMNGLDVAYEGGDWIPGGHRPRRAFVRFPEPIGRQLVARYPVGEVITVPRHVVSREVVARISSASVAPAAAAPLLPALTPALGRLLRSPARGLLDRVIDRLPEGPAEDARGAVRWTIVAGAEGEDGRTARGIVQGPDIYGVTAEIVAETAMQLARRSRGAIGALAPAQAVDPAGFLDHLGTSGVTWNVHA